VVALFVVAASGLAWREGGGADARRPPPAMSVANSSPPVDPTASRAPRAFEVKRRLMDALADATLDAPNLTASLPFMQPYWRRMRSPWTHPSNTAASMALTLAIRTSREAEKQLSVAVAGGDSWVPQARVWNMNEGSFDQRESIFAPSPATLTFRIEVPPAARLRVSPAVLAEIPGATVFQISVVDASGAEQVISSTRIAGGDARTWIDVDADLGPWGGQRVDLRLKTTTESPGPDEPRWVAPKTSDEGQVDAGAAERMPVPPMSLAVWGDPVVVADEPARTPYNVLWVVVDALRPDVVAALHDAAEDAARRAAHRPPLDALLPAVPGLMPSLDGLATRGVRFTHAWSAATWTRAGTLAMLAGERSSEAGIDTTGWILQPAAMARYYATPPPLLPLLLRRVGVETAAFVNNFFLAGYVPVGVDMGFERVTDHRYRTRDTGEITRDSIAWLQTHARDRFFLFVNYNSPHEPYDPPRDMLARVPPPPAGPADRQVRGYMAEGAKDDAAIGQLLGALDGLSLTANTLVVVTADHGETLSTAHDGEGLEGIRQRFHHAVGNFEETTRVPLLMSLPGVLDGGKAVTDRVRSTDIAPTVLDVLGLEPDPRMSGRSLLPLVRGVHEADARVVVSEGRQSRAILWGHFRLVTRDGSDQPLLFDLDDDPGERHDVARAHPDVVAELQARLAAALANVPAADARDPGSSGAPIVHLRFATAGRARKVSGELHAGDDRHAATLTYAAIGVPPEAMRATGSTLTFALTTSPEALVGLDLRTDPPGASLTWRLFLDDAPWPAGATFAGPFGLPAVAVSDGIAGDEARSEAYASRFPVVDPALDLGLFVTRDRPDRAGAPDSSGRGGTAAAAASAATREMQQVLQQWGYAHGSH
jgi:arylsulfatase A-like enzyme